METPNCAYCSKNWSYGTTLKNIFKLTMTCPHCGKENYYDSRGKGSMGTLILAPLVIILGAILNLPLEWLLIAASILIAGHFLLFPYRTRLKKTEKK